jgi:DNA-binding transcriptional regulator YiaG
MLPQNHFMDKFQALMARAKAREKAADEEEKSEVRDSKLFIRIRKELRVSQKELAGALAVSIHTVRGWEHGKAIPVHIYILMELMRDMPAVRRRLLVWW